MEEPKDLSNTLWTCPCFPDYKWLEKSNAGTEFLATLFIQQGTLSIECEEFTYITQLITDVFINSLAWWSSCTEAQVS